MICCGLTRKNAETRQELYNKLYDTIEIFEKDSLKLAALIKQDGAVSAYFSREDLTVSQVDSLLDKIAGFSRHCHEVSRVLGAETVKPVHLKGLRTIISLYDVRDEEIMAIVLDTNSLFSDRINCSDIENVVSSKLKEVFKL